MGAFLGGNGSADFHRLCTGSVPPLDDYFIVARLLPVEVPGPAIVDFVGVGSGNVDPVCSPGEWDEGQEKGKAENDSCTERGHHDWGKESVIGYCETRTLGARTFNPFKS